MVKTPDKAKEKIYKDILRAAINDELIRLEFGFPQSIENNEEAEIEIESVASIDLKLVWEFLPLMKLDLNSIDTQKVEKYIKKLLIFITKVLQAIETEGAENLEDFKISLKPTPERIAAAQKANEFRKRIQAVLDKIDNAENKETEEALLNEIKRGILNNKEPYYGAKNFSDFVKNNLPNGGSFKVRLEGFLRKRGILDLLEEKPYLNDSDRQFLENIKAHLPEIQRVINGDKKEIYISHLPEALVHFVLKGLSSYKKQFSTKLGEMLRKFKTLETFFQFFGIDINIDKILDNLKNKVFILEE